MRTLILSNTQHHIHQTKSSIFKPQHIQMKKTITTIFILLLSSAFVYCQTQADMNIEASNTFKKADKELNKIYTALFNKLDASEKKALSAAEKAWITFRDLECKFECKENEGGSIYPLVYSTCLTSLTEKRTAELKELLKEMEGK